MNTPLLSVSVVTYNHEDYLRACLQGIVDQVTNFPFEVVVGEDCSTDGTRAILKEFEKNYPDKIVPIYHDTNVGATRNLFDYVFPNLRGKYIAICDGDDYWIDNHKLQKQVDYMEAHPECALTFHEANTIDQHGVQTEKGVADGIIKVFQPLDIIRISFPTVSAVFRNHFREKRPEMMDTKSYDSFIFAVLSGYGGAANLSFVGANYRHHTGGIYSMRPKFTQYHWTIVNRKKMRATSIFNEAQKKALTKEIWRRKKLYIKYFLKRFEPVNAFKILIA